MSIFFFRYSRTKVLQMEAGPGADRNDQRQARPVLLASPNGAPLPALEFTALNRVLRTALRSYTRRMIKQRFSPYQPRRVNYTQVRGARRLFATGIRPTGKPFGPPALRSNAPFLMFAPRSRATLFFKGKTGKNAPFCIADFAPFFGARRKKFKQCREVHKDCAVYIYKIKDKGL